MMHPFLRFPQSRKIIFASAMESTALPIGTICCNLLYGTMAKICATVYAERMAAKYSDRIAIARKRQEGFAG